MNYKKLFKFSLLSLGLLSSSNVIKAAQDLVVIAIREATADAIRTTAELNRTLDNARRSIESQIENVQLTAKTTKQEFAETVAAAKAQMAQLERETNQSIVKARDAMERTTQEAQQKFDRTTADAERNMNAAVSKATGDMDKTAQEATGRIQTTASNAQSSIEHKKSEATGLIDSKTTSATEKITAQATASEGRIQAKERSAQNAIEQAQRELAAKEVTINNNVATAQRALEATAQKAEDNINKAEVRTKGQLQDELNRAKAQAEAIYKASVEECQRQAILTRKAAEEAQHSLTATQTEKTKAEEAARKAAESVRDVTRTFDAKTAALDAKHAEEIRKLNETLAAKRRELDQALRDSQTALERTLAENTARLEAERQELRTTLDAERVQLTTHLRDEREAYDRRAQATIQHFDKTLDTAKESLVAEREVYLDAVKQEQQNSEARLAEEQEQQKRFLDLLNKQHLLELEETQARAIHEGMLSQVHAATMIQDLTRLGKLQTHQDKLKLSKKAEEELEATRHEHNQQVAEFKVKGKKEVAQIDAETQKEITAIKAKAENERAKAQREAEARHNKEKLAAEEKAMKEKIAAEERHNKEKLELEEKVKAHEREQAHKQKLLDIEKEGRLHAEKLAAERALKILDNEATAQRLKDKLQFGKESITSVGTGLVNLTNDHKRMLRIAGSVGCGATLIYAAKYGLPHLFAYLVQPRVVSETSKKSLFGWTAPSHEATLDELTFTPELQHILGDIALQLKTAREHGENLPNILFAGPPGTGKTAFAKALARLKSDKGELLFDYALTSGSEFAKIKDLNLATNELRKMIRWAQKSNKPMIIFIDEAESLFSDRTLPETPKSATDFINAFLSMVQDKSQKNICFIFATNHMFKLDSAIFNRVGKPIEFTLPGTTELAKILSTYVTKFAKANATSMVTIGKDFEVNYGSYAHELLGSVPRDIKFIAEQMIIKTRRTSNKILTDSIGRSAIKEAQRTLAMKESLEKNKATWMKQKTAITAQG